MSAITSYFHDGLTFEVSDQGPARSEVVVLLHGFPQTRTSWDQVTPFLNEAGYRTLAPDLRGYSPAARPRRRRDYNLRYMVDDVVALIDEVGQPVHVVGHDWGAATAWSLAAMRPEHVRTLTAVSVPHPGAMLSVGLPQLKKSWYMFVNQIPFAAELLMSDRKRARKVLRGTGMPPAAIDRYVTEIIDTGAMTTALNWYRGLPFTSRKTLKSRVRVPTTMVWSDGDQFLHRLGAERSVDYVDADFKLEIMEGLSHWIPDEAPEQLAEIILARAASIADSH
ncbi:MAG TPA: alpha/beta hydrolase [Marmoricola sp.]|nr:alpha/beta hydrolase [Nocardioidaceae bacterium]MCB8993213.1 alpha/beta hydrolase [Nocardioidaceae bacterium]HRV69718.1 alpha/beta hydrolase [Marmoricola sp.]